MHLNLQKNPVHLRPLLTVRKGAVLHKPYWSGPHWKPHWSPLVATLVPTGYHWWPHWSPLVTTLASTGSHWSLLVRTSYHWSPLVTTGSHTGL